MRKNDLAYTAGIVDGEGCISLSNRRGAGSVYLNVSVANTNEWLIQWLKFCYGGATSCSIFREGIRKPLWRWGLSSNNALEFLKLIYPYLRLKKPQADLAIKFQEARRTRKRTCPLTNKVKVLEEADRVLMASFNKKGITV